jgi:hypothetical protein
MSVKPKIIYIAGAGHSGSTLLDLAISTAPEAFSVGEVKHLDEFLTHNKLNQKDDTGAEAADSVFWSYFFNNKERYLPTETTEKVLSWKNRLQIVLRGKPAAIPRCYKDNKELYCDIQTQAKAVEGVKPTVIVDSSKVLSRLIEINERTDLDVYVIHLVRDVRGVVYSNYKVGRSALKWAFVWVLTNVGIARYAKKNVSNTNYLRLSYEDFVASPETHLNKIADQVGLDIDTTNVVENMNTQKSYRFGGNGMRCRQIKEIKQDEKWRTKLPLPYQFFLTPLNILFR